MTGYVRQRDAQISSGSVIYAADIKAELDQVQTSHNSTAGHRHNGTTGEGAPITVVGPAQDLVVSTTSVLPKTTDTLSLGSTLVRFKEAFFNGVVTALTFVGNLTGNVTGNLTGNVTGNLTGNVTGNVTGAVTGNLTGNADTVTNGVYTVSDQTVGGNKTFSSPIILPSGGVLGPALTHAGNTDTGIYFPAPKTVGICGSGNPLASFAVASARIYAPLAVASGSNAAPSIVNAVGDNTGIVMGGSGTSIGFSVNGTSRATIDGTSLDAPNITIDNSQVYCRDNILAPVFQTLGVPAGGIIESGSNANGEYTKFADGTQICWKYTIASPSASTASGPLFTNAAEEIWVFPTTFSALPTVVSSTSGASARWATVSSISSSQAGIRVFSTVTSAANVPVNAIAIGRWF